MVPTAMLHSKKTSKNNPSQMKFLFKKEFNPAPDVNYLKHF